MGFWFFTLATCALVPLTMILCGRMFLRSAPDVINPVFGYRTALSMKNKDTWAFAHAHCGRLWTRVGTWMLPASLLIMLFVINKDMTVIGTVCAAVTIAQCAAPIFCIFPTERALKKHFNANGSRRAEK